MTESSALRFPGVYANTHVNKPAVIMAETGAVMTYDELDAYANKIGRFFQSLGLKAGDHVAYCLENRLECPALQWAAHYVGLYYTFVSSRLTGEEAAFIVEDCQAKVFIVSAKTAPAVLESIRKLSVVPELFSIDPVSGMKLLSDAAVNI